MEASTEIVSTDEPDPGADSGDSADSELPVLTTALESEDPIAPWAQEGAAPEGERRYTAEIVAAIKSAGGPQLDKRVIELGEHIKTVGKHQVSARLHADVKVSVQLEVKAKP